MLMESKVSGFSLVELIVAIGILAGMLALVAPSMSDWVAASRTRNVAEALQDGLLKAQVEALKSNTSITFWLVTSPGNSAPPDKTCLSSASSGSWVIGAEKPDGRCQDFHSNYGMTAIDGLSIRALASDGTDATSVGFNGYGQVASSGKPISRIDLVHTNSSVRKLSIEVLAGGGVHMCDRDVKVPAGDPRACVL